MNQEWWRNTSNTYTDNAERVRLAGTRGSCSVEETLLATMVAVIAAAGMELGRIADALEKQGAKVSDEPVPTTEV